MNQWQFILTCLCVQSEKRASTQQDLGDRIPRWRWPGRPSWSPGGCPWWAGTWCLPGTCRSSRRWRRRGGGRQLPASGPQGLRPTFAESQRPGETIYIVKILVHFEQACKSLPQEQESPRNRHFKLTEPGAKDEWKGLQGWRLSVYLISEFFSFGNWILQSLGTMFQSQGLKGAVLFFLILSTKLLLLILRI